MLNKTGVPTQDDIRSVFPSEERINEGPVAIIECYQRIPCNPCSTACPREAISLAEDINNLPGLNKSRCNGCGRCISVCSGLAIIVVDGSYSDDEVLFKIPYEQLPLPKEGDRVKGLNRAGDYITDGQVIRCLNPKSFDKTPVVHVVVNRRFLYDFRHIKVEGV